MTQQPTYSPQNPHPFAQLRTVLERHKIYDQQIYDRLQITPQQLMEFCQRWRIAELAVFGSILRDDFRVGGDDPSDVDFLYILDRGVSYGFEIVQMRDELAELVKRPVDLISQSVIQRNRNWLRRKTILESKRTIYGQRSASPYPLEKYGRLTGCCRP